MMVPLRGSKVGLYMYSNINRDHVPYIPPCRMLAVTVFPALSKPRMANVSSLQQTNPLITQHINLNEKLIKITPVAVLSPSLQGMLYSTFPQQVSTE